MAEFQNSSSAKTNTFNKGMVKDYSNIFIGEGIWTNAINAINKTHHGELGTLGNEPSNRLCTSASFSIIGYAHIEKTRWVIFSTNDNESEIGIFEESNCSYTVLINDTCLNFNRANLITAITKENYDCTFSVYWQDNNNPDRVMNLSKIPYKQHYEDVNNPGVPVSQCPDGSCCELVNDSPLTLDCDAIRLHPLINQACVSVKRSNGSGQLQNGSYMACIAYTENSIRLTDYCIPSQPQGLWNHTATGNSLEVEISNIDTRFEEYELVIISVINQNTVAKRIGIYSTQQTKIVIDIILQSLATIDLALIPLKSVVYDKSEKMFEVNGYLIRTSVTTKPIVNYQPLANKIKANWKAVRYPADYYWNGGNNVGLMREEVYTFFIRWIYNNGTRTASYHIPGREAIPAIDRVLVTSANENQVESYETEAWQVGDTGIIPFQSLPLNSANTTSDGGIVFAKGEMAFWESESEKYPIDNYDVWEDLCGQKIRHHKMPSNETIHIHDDIDPNIIVLGVEFSNIQPPVDENGQVITDIVGYEILRGSREGNRSIIAKGMFNNMWDFSYKETSNHQGITKKGLYQNYPYNDINDDVFLTDDYTILDWQTQTIGFNSYSANVESSSLLGSTPSKGTYKTDYYSFHSPDTNFNKPYLGQGSYIKIYTREDATVVGKFELPYKHPKFKLITDGAFLTSVYVGVGIGLLAAMGKVTTSSSVGPVIPAAAVVTVTKSDSSVLSNSLVDLGLAAISPASTAGTVAGVIEFIARIAYFSNIGISQTIRLIENFIKYRDYALQYNSHGHYAISYKANSGNGYRRKIKNNGAKYIGSGIQDFNNTYRIFNLNRNKFVAIQLEKIIFPILGVDNSRKRLKDINTTKPFYDKPYDYGYITSQSAAWYGAIKVHNRNQYGQIDSIVQLPVSCVFDKAQKTTTEVIFGGDTYINRYTEKNPYMFFNTWLFDVLDGTEFTYTNYINGPCPRYWANFNSYDSEDFDVDTGFNNTNILGGLLPTMSIKTPSDNHRLDRHQNIGVAMAVRRGWFYLFYNGVRDFYCESELNIAFRDYGEKPEEKFYDPYGLSLTDLSTMFRSDLIKEQIQYKYDLSLSTSKLYNNFSTWGTVLPRSYNPSDYSSCYEYYAKRAIYSLQQRTKMKRDSWLNFLPLNYKDFDGKINNIKSLNATGAIILFEDAEPRSFVGVDELQTTGGVKVTIGDSGLFQQNMQGFVNADDILEYGSCQSYRSAVNTPAGLFYVSQRLGKIFQYGGNLQDISMAGMKHWFNEFLPSKLLQVYPDYNLYDNPVKGIGVQAIYDNTFDLLYISKKDYKPLRDDLLYGENGEFYYTESTIVCNAGYTYNSQTGLCEKEGEEPMEPTIRNINVPCHFDNPRCWKDAHWTISYDPINKMWISFHEWVPDLLMPSHDHFYSIKEAGIWKHNDEWDSYLNFYGKDYGWEVEYPITTPNNVTTLRSLEYTLEVYKYYNEGMDYNHILDENFDRAVIYNSEQISGLLKLNLKGKNAPLDLINYPIVTSNSIDILYSKEENKYRINQFWDVTKDRGEFSGNTIPMFVTEDNGYKKSINPLYTNYLKLERKKFRHYGNVITLRKNAIPLPKIGNGRLYNAHAVNNLSEKFTSSDIWHVPSDTEWNTLISYIDPTANLSILGIQSTIVGGKLKSIRTYPQTNPYWQSPNTGATDYYKFNAEGSGSRFDSIEIPILTYQGLHQASSFWSSTERSPQTIPSQMYVRGIFYNNSNILRYTARYNFGFSVRLVRDASIYEQTLNDGTQCSNYIGNDGIQYKTVKIGTQVWTAENSIETKYRSGNPIIEITNSTQWGADGKGARCDYNNDYNNVYFYEGGTIADLRNKKYILKLTNSKHLNSFR